MNMLTRVQRLIKKLGTNDPEILLNTLGVKILEFPMTGLRGIYKRVQRNTVVIVDNQLEPRERSFVLAHELGHHILHRGDNRVYLDRCTLFKSSRYEKEADLFAVCLLAPDLSEVIMEEDTLSDISCRIGVSEEIAEIYLEEVRKSGWIF